MANSISEVLNFGYAGSESSAYPIPVSATARIINNPIFF